MSSHGALLVGLLGLIALGAFAAWLVNVPLWGIGGLVAVALVMLRWLFRWILAKRTRQKAEA